MMRYSLASRTWDDKEVAAIRRVIDSDRYTMGANVAGYEEAFAEYFGSSYAVMVNSGSTANLLMIASLFFTDQPRLKVGDEIIVPAVSWSTTYFPLQQYGLKVKFVDIDPDTLNIDLKKLEAAITAETKAILAVNLLGNPNDFDRIREMTVGTDIFLLEDNCESMGAEYRGRCSGTFGLMGTFSSFFSHHISTMEGGCIVTDDEELHHVLLALRAHGWTRDLPKENRVSGFKSDDPFEESFKFVLPGYNVRPLEMSGAIGLEQLNKLPEFVDIRRQNAEYLISRFKDHSCIRIQKEIGASSWFGFSLIITEDAPFDRKTMVQEFHRAGIECRPIVSGNFLKNADVLRFFDYTVAGSTECAEYIDRNGLFVGNHHVRITEEIDHLYDVCAQLAG